MQPLKRQRRDGTGAVRNVRRPNYTPGGEQVKIWSHVSVVSVWLSSCVKGAQRSRSRCACCACLQVIDLTHFPDRVEPNGGAAAHAREPRQNYADVPGVRRNAQIRAQRRVRAAPGGAAPGPAQVPRVSAGVVHQLVQAVPPVQFQSPGARAAPRVSRKNSNGQHDIASASTPPQEDSAPTCAICLDSLKENLCCAPCGHVFHYKCLREAIVKFKYCPTCRKPIKGEKTIKKIFL